MIDNWAAACSVSGHSGEAGAEPNVSSSSVIEETVESGATFADALRSIRRPSMNSTGTWWLRVRSAVSSIPSSTGWQFT